MEYLKEFQSFAERFSTLADEKLQSIDGGTYNEAFRFYSRRQQAEVGTVGNDQQRQLEILFDELRKAIKSPALLSVEAGTVLYVGSADSGTAAALGHLCAALEKCIFFGAVGAAPDFWTVLAAAAEQDARGEWAGVTSSNTALVPDRGDPLGVSGRAREKERQGGGGSGCGGTPVHLASMIRQLTRVQTGHGRCRAWARALLALDSAARDNELRRAATAAHRAVEGALGKRGGGMSGATGDHARSEIGSESPGQGQIVTQPSDPDAGGGIGPGSQVPRKALVASVQNEGVEKCRRQLPQRDTLPLWLRPGPESEVIRQDLCRYLKEFQGYLQDKGLSVQASLDHAWLDHENIAAATTYTWPSFPKEALRCFVQGAGFSAAIGEYSPSQADGVAGGVVSLSGPNDCRICCEVYRAANAGVDNAQRRTSNGSVAVTGDGRPKADPTDPATRSSGDATAEPHLGKRWCLLVPDESGLDMRVAYFTLGDGPLPPARGWKAVSTVDMPPPSLSFGTQNEGQSVTGDDLVAVNQNDEDVEASFATAVPVSVGDNATTGLTATSYDTGDEGMPPTGQGAGNSSRGEGGRALRRQRRKRQRSPPPAIIHGIDSDPGLGRCKRAEAHEIGGERDLRASTCGDGSGDGRAIAGCDGSGADTCSLLDERDIDESERCFKSERWVLPAPSGNLLERAQRTYETLRRIAENREATIARHRARLSGKLAAAEKEHRNVASESVAATVSRVLSSKPALQAEAENDILQQARRASSDDQSSRADRAVPSLEELVAEKVEELRTRPPGDGVTEEQTTTAPPPSPDAADRTSDEPRLLVGVPPIVAATDVSWPWPVDWLTARAAEPVEDGLMGVDVEVNFDVFGGMDEAAEPDDGDRPDMPPFSIEVAAVEVADIEDPEAAHVEYVLRVIYRERQTPSHESDAIEEGAAGKPGWTADDPQALRLKALATASKGLIQRTRVLTKRLNSLCALHPKVLSVLEETRQIRPEAARIVDTPVFPDPFELGTLEESILRVYRDPLTPRFKANAAMRKLKVQIGSYLSGVLYFLGILEAICDHHARARVSRTLNEALSTCDRAGRKRRRGDFVVGMRIEDIAGGRLGSGNSDEERLRIQKRRCMGCKRTIAAEFLGMRKDYFPCRYADGLFCRSYCHREDRRVIPHRMLHHWDFTPHRVCKDALAFLDATQLLPVLTLPEGSPRSLPDQQAVRLVRSRRKQLCRLRQAIFFPVERMCIAGTRLLEELLDGRMHLAEDIDLYSADDLIGIKKGTLLDMLEEAIESLLAHVMEDCEACEAQAARVCTICHSTDVLYTFQTAKVARCPGCGSLFHAKCAASRIRSKTAAIETRRRHGQTTIEPGVVCPQCDAAGPLSEVTE